MKPSKEYYREYYHKNANKISAASKKRYYADPEKARAKSRAWYHNNKEKASESSHRRYHGLRDTILSHYGSHCHCCGETEKGFLAIDHVNGDGNLDRKSGYLGVKFYNRIISENYPDSYRILCHNCNMATRFGPCPHESAHKTLLEALCQK